jgi:hypothetical protein
MKAQRKPIAVEVVQYHAGQPLPPELDGIVHFTGSSGGLNVASVYNKPHNAQLVVNDGDYVRIDNPDDIYPMTPKHFDELYEAI